MDKIKIGRKLEFDAAHRIMNHESKCCTLHGHRYTVIVEAEAAKLDQIGRVIDFAIIKEKIGAWIERHWDHNTVLFDKDVETVKALQSIPRAKEPWLAPWNPTAENMAIYLLKTVCPNELKGTSVLVTKVTVWETPNCFAEASLT